MVASIEEILGLKFKPGAKQAAQGRRPSVSKVGVDYDTDTRRFVSSVFPLSENSGVNDSNIVGTQVFARINSDTDHEDSKWVDVYKDKDGDLSVDVDIDYEAWVDNDMAFEFNNQLKKIPIAARRINDAGNLIINVDGFIALNFKFSSLLKKLDAPADVNAFWYHDKFLYEPPRGWFVHDKTKWVRLDMPVDDSLIPNGVYVFK